MSIDPFDENNLPSSDDPQIEDKMLDIQRANDGAVTTIIGSFGNDDEKSVTN